MDADLRYEGQQHADAAKAGQHVAQLARVAQLRGFQHGRGAIRLTAAAEAVHACRVVQRTARRCLRQEFQVWHEKQQLSCCLALSRIAGYMVR